MRWLLITGLLLGCTAREAAAALPRLVARGALVQSAGAGGEEWGWRVSGGLAWRPAAASLAPAPEPAESRSVRASFPCADEALCAWERRAVEGAQMEAQARLEEGESP